MSTGWRWITSDGQEFKSQVATREYLRNHPDVRITFSELSMGGTKETDVTDQFLAAVADSETNATICDECGSGILNGEHIANYTCSKR